jgi:hypothetical protein
MVLTIGIYGKITILLQGGHRMDLILSIKVLEHSRISWWNVPFRLYRTVHAELGIDYAGVQGF